MGDLTVEGAQRLAQRHGYEQVQLEYGEGVIAFRRLASDGSAELVRVWWRTGTVGSYLKHPRQGRTQLFRRDVCTHRMLGDILSNPRRHTGTGYHTRSGGGGGGGGGGSSSAKVACPGCGRRYRSTLGAVCHVEQGYCPSCPGRDAGRRAVYDVVSGVGASFVLGAPQIEYYDDYSNYDDGYDADGKNYYCQGCGREFNQLNSLMQHQRAKPECVDYAGAPLAAIGY